MSDSHLAVMDHIVQQTNVWLKAIAGRLGVEHRPAGRAHLPAQLPTRVRGIYYDGWHMAGKPTKERSAEDFAFHVLAQLPTEFPLDPLTVTSLSFSGRKLDPGEFAKL